MRTIESLNATFQCSGFAVGCCRFNFKLVDQKKRKESVRVSLNLCTCCTRLLSHAVRVHICKAHRIASAAVTAHIETVPALPCFLGGLSLSPPPHTHTLSKGDETPPSGWGRGHPRTNTHTHTHTHTPQRSLSTGLPCVALLVHVICQRFEFQRKANVSACQQV